MKNEDIVKMLSNLIDEIRIVKEITLELKHDYFVVKNKLTAMDLRYKEKQKTLGDTK
jgi:hypothetical protein